MISNILIFLCGLVVGCLATLVYGLITSVNSKVGIIKTITTYAAEKVKKWIQSRN